MTGILAAALVERMAAAHPAASLLAPTLITLGLASIATGLVLCGFGLSRLGRAIRYVPYPVVGGFLGATGCLILLGAVRVITGHRLQFATLGEFADATILLELGAAIAMAVVLYLTWHRSRSPIGLPVILIGGVLLGHLGLRVAGFSLADAQGAGWVFVPPPRKFMLMLPWAEIEHYPWRIFADLSVDLVAVIFVTASSTLFNTAGIEVATQRDANLERELDVTGLANIASGAFGGYRLRLDQPHDPQLQCRRPRPDRRPDRLGDRAAHAGAGDRPARLHPKFVLGGLLIYLGAEWLPQMDRRIAQAHPRGCGQVTPIK